MKKTFALLIALLVVGLMGFTALGHISFCTETDGGDAWCFGDSDYLYFGTDRDAKIAWVTDSCVFTTDLDIVGAVDITGSLTFSGALAVTGNFTADGAVMSVDGSTSVDLISAGHVDIEAPNIRLGLNATEYMNLATTVTSGNLAITHPGKTPAVTWTATSFDFTGTFAADALTLSDVLTFSDAATIDNSAADTLQLTEDNIDLVGACAADALTLSDVLTFSGAGTIDNTTADILMLTEATVAVTGIFDVTGNFTQDGTAVSIDGDTTCDILGATRIDIESPLIYLGRDVDDYMLLTTTDTSGNLAITHEGTPAVTWTAASFDFVGTMALDATTLSDVLTFSDAATIDNTAANTLTLVEDNVAVTGNFAVTGNLDVNGTTALVDGSTSARMISATLASVEAANVRLGVSAAIYIDFAATAGSGDMAITHTGTDPDVTWAADSLTFTGAFEVAGASTFEAITGVGNLDINGTTAVIDGATSVRAISAGFNSLEGPANRFGSDASWYMQVATTATTGDTAITHTGGSPDVTWAATSLTFTGVFEVVGASTFEAITGVGNLDINATTALIDGATSVRLVSAGFTSLEGPAHRFGVDDTFYTNFAIATTTGNLTITHVGGSTDLVTWTAAGGFDFNGAFEADALTLTDALTFSGGGVMDNTAADTITITEDNIVLTGAVGVTVTDTGPFTVGPDPVVLNHQQRVTVGQLIAGPHELLPAVVGRTYRIVDVVAIAYGGAVGTTTTVDILGDRSGAVKLFTFGQPQLTQSTVLTINETGVVVLADGASFDPLDAATAITASFTGGNPDTATGVDFIITYVLE